MSSVLEFSVKAVQRARTISADGSPSKGCYVRIRAGGRITELKQVARLDLEVETEPEAVAAWITRNASTYVDGGAYCRAELLDVGETSAVDGIDLKDPTGYRAPGFPSAGKDEERGALVTVIHELLRNNLELSRIGQERDATLLEAMMTVGELKGRLEALQGVTAERELAILYEQGANALGVIMPYLPAVLESFAAGQLRVSGLEGGRRMAVLLASLDTTTGQLGAMLAADRDLLTPEVKKRLIEHVKLIASAPSLGVTVTVSGE